MANNVQVKEKATELIRGLDDDALLEALWLVQYCRKRGDQSGEEFWLEVGTEIQKIQQPSHFVNL